MNSIISSLIMAGMCLAACSDRRREPVQIERASVNQKIADMKNPVSIVEIPATDFSRAMNFYQNILGIKIEVVEMQGMKIGLFPNSPGGIVVQLISADGYNPSADGTVVYLNGGDDLKKMADQVEAAGGKMLIPKTEIGPEMGFYAIFTDTEGNKLGLHSTH